MRLKETIGADTVRSFAGSSSVEQAATHPNARPSAIPALIVIAPEYHASTAGVQIEAARLATAIVNHAPSKPVQEVPCGSRRLFSVPFSFSSWEPCPRGPRTHQRLSSHRLSQSALTARPPSEHR